MTTTSLIRRMKPVFSFLLCSFASTICADALGQTSFGELSVSVRDENACNDQNGLLYASEQNVQLRGRGYAPGTTVSLSAFLRSGDTKETVDLGNVQANGLGVIDATAQIYSADKATGLIKAIGTGADGNNRRLQAVLFIVESASDDDDNDGTPNICDLCPTVASVDQSDTDQDGLGDACDPFPEDPRNDSDNDGISGHIDFCPSDPANDEDGDAVCGRLDNCPAVPNPTQEDTDLDGVGDACLNDLFAHAGFDKRVSSGSAVTLSGGLSRPVPLEYQWFQQAGPSVAVSATNEATIRFDAPIVQSNSTIEFGLVVSDSTNESSPDFVSVVVVPVEAADSDGDGVADNVDNCPDTPNPDQSDSDGDGIGDPCDTPDEPRQCDIDLDGDVDRADVMLIFAARNQPAEPGDPRDIDGDGIITVLDGRACTLQCDRPACQ